MSQTIINLRWIPGKGQPLKKFFETTFSPCFWLAEAKLMEVKEEDFGGIYVGNNTSTGSIISDDKLKIDNIIARLVFIQLI